MSYDLRFLPEGDVLHGTWNGDFNFKEEIRAFDQTAWTMLEQLSTPVYFIIEFNSPQLTVPEIMIGAKVFTEGKSTFNHPMITRILLVTKYSLYRMAAKGMNSAPFGHIDMEVFKTLDEALEFAHSHGSVNQSYNTERIS